MVFVVGTDMTALGQQNLSGDVTALFPRQFGAIFRAHYASMRYFKDEWLGARTPVSGFNTKTNERIGDSLLKLFNRGYNIEVPASGGTAVTEAIKRDRYIIKVDDEPSVKAETWTDYDAKMSVDGGRSFMMNVAKQDAAALAKANDLNAISTVWQTGSLPDYAYGGSGKTKEQAGELVWGTSVGDDAKAGIIVDANLDSADVFVAGNAVEDFLDKGRRYLDHLGATGRRIAIMSSTCMYNWVKATGKVMNLTAASNFTPTRAIEYGDQSSYGRGSITGYRGFDIYEIPWMDAFGDEMNAHFNATDFGGAAGSKYMPGSSYNSTSTNKMAVHRIATQADLANGVFEQNNGANNPAQWATGVAHFTQQAYNKYRITIFCPDECIEELHLYEPNGQFIPKTSMLGGIYFAYKMNGYGPIRGESVLSAVSAKG